MCFVRDDAWKTKWELGLAKKMQQKKEKNKSIVLRPEIDGNNKPDGACISKIMWSFNGLIVYSSAHLAVLIASESEWHCPINVRKSVKQILWSAVRPNLLYTSSANRHATFVWRPTRTKIVSSSMRFRCVDCNFCASVALVSSLIALLSKWFHSWNRLFDKLSKSKWSDTVLADKQCSACVLMIYLF